MHKQGALQLEPKALQSERAKADPKLTSTDTSEHMVEAGVLNYAVQQRIDTLFSDTRDFNPQMIDGRARDFLIEIPPDQAIEALEEFHEVTIYLH